VNALVLKDERRIRGQRSRVVVPLPNEINAVLCLKAIARALNHLAFSQRWLMN
jgi:hypothetical protein